MTGGYRTGVQVSTEHTWAAVPPSHARFQYAFWICTPF